MKSYYCTFSEKATGRKISVSSAILSELSGKSVDELAPSLGNIIAGIIGETLYLYANPIEFIKITYPTDTFRKIIGDIVSTMSNASGSKTFIQMLNLEMGSGKTHLLTLLYHLFFTLRCKYNIPLDDDIKRKLREFDYYDFKDRRIVVLPIDFRTKNFKTQLRAWVESLRCEGEDRIAQDLEGRISSNYCSDSMPENCLPNPIDFAGERGINPKFDVVLIIDELFYGVKDAAVNPQIKQSIISMLNFIRSFIDRRREFSDNGKSALIVLIATARDDFDWWGGQRKIELEKSMPDLTNAVDFLLQSISRTITSSTVQWLNVDDALRIICTRLGFGECNTKNMGPLHSNFIDFIGRVFTYFPGAQHLRSLLKAMASYALTACELGDPVISPAHFNETVIDALLPGNMELTNMYKGMYSAIKNYIGSKFSDEVLRNALNYAVGALFTGSITSDMHELIMDYIQASGSHVLTSKPNIQAPLVTEDWIADSISQLMANKPNGMNYATEAIRQLHVLPNVAEITDVDVGGGPRKTLYTVLPWQNLELLFTEYIEHYREEFRKKSDDEFINRVKDEVLRYIKPSPGSVWMRIRVIDRICKEDGISDEVRSEIQALRNNELYILITLNDDDEKIKNCIKIMASEGITNATIAVIKADLRRARQEFIDYLSIYNASMEFINYVTSMLRDSIRTKVVELKIEKTEETINKLINVLKRDASNIVSNYMSNNGLSSLQQGLQKALTALYYYDPYGSTIKVEPVSFSPAIQEKLFRNINIEKAKELINTDVERAAGMLADKLAEYVAGKMNYIYKSQQNILDAWAYDICDHARKSGRYELYYSRTPIVIIGNQAFTFYKHAYNVMVQGISSIIRDKCPDLEVENKDVVIIIKRRKEVQQEVPQIQPTPTLPKGPIKNFDELIRKIDEVRKSGIKVRSVSIELKEVNNEEDFRRVAMILSTFRSKLSKVIISTEKEDIMYQA